MPFVRLSERNQEDYHLVRRWTYRDIPDPPSLIGAAMRLYNPLFSLTNVGNAITDQINVLGRTNPGYDPWKDIPENLRAPGLISSFINANNKEDVARISSEIYRELEDRKVLEESNGFAAFGASALAGLTDPVQYIIPGSLLFKATKGANALRRAGQFAFAGMLSNIPTEIALQAGVQTRTWQESAIDTLAVGILTGTFGAAFGHLSSEVKTDLTNDIKTLLLPSPKEYLALPPPRRFPEGEVTAGTPNIYKLEREAALLNQDIAILEKRVPYLAGENQAFILDRIAEKRTKLESLQRDISDLTKDTSGVLVDTATGLPTISRSFPLGSVTPEALVPRLSQGEEFPIVPRQTYDIEQYPSISTKERNRYAPWNTVLSFPGEQVSNKNRQWLSRLLPQSDSNVPVYFDKELQNVIQKGTIKRIQELETQIDKLIEQFHEDALNAMVATDGRRRAGFKRKAKNRGKKILDLENQIYNELETARLSEGFSELFNSVKIERDGYQYYVPRDFFESGFKIQTTDGISNPLDIQTSSITTPVLKKHPDLYTLEEIPGEINKLNTMLGEELDTARRSEIEIAISDLEIMDMVLRKISTE